MQNDNTHGFVINCDIPNLRSRILLSVVLTADVLSFNITLTVGGVAQLVRASACHAEGREFESRHSRHSILDQF